MAETAAKWLDGWPEKSVWRKYFPEDSERWPIEGICPECREAVAASKRSESTAAMIGGLQFVFHTGCFESFELLVEQYPIDWAVHA